LAEKFLGLFYQRKMIPLHDCIVEGVAFCSTSEQLQFFMQLR